MIRIADFIDRRERRTLTVLALLFAGAFLFLIAGGLGARRDGLRARAALRAARDGAAKAEADRADKQAWFDLWAGARKDLAEMRGKELYDGQEGIGVLRADVDRLLADSGFAVPRLSYNYGSQDKGSVYRVGVSFDLRGSYGALKTLLENIEAFPRLLVVDDLDLKLSTGAGGGPVLRLTLGAYYEK